MQGAQEGQLIDQQAFAAPQQQLQKRKYDPQGQQLQQRQPRKYDPRGQQQEQEQQHQLKPAPGGSSRPAAKGEALSLSFGSFALDAPVDTQVSMDSPQWWPKRPATNAVATALPQLKKVDAAAEEAATHHVLVTPSAARADATVAPAGLAADKEEATLAPVQELQQAAQQAAKPAQVWHPLLLLSQHN